MVGNPSTPLLSLTALALRATVITPYNIVAEEPASVNGWRTSLRKKQRHRRLAGDSSGSKGAVIMKDDQQRRRRERLIEILAESGAAFLHAADSDEQLAALSLSRPIDSEYDDSSSDCLMSNRAWHPDLTNSNIACSNSLSYPSLWDDDASIHEAVMFDSSQYCCDALLEIMGDGYFGECSIINDCSKADNRNIATTERRAACISKGWHTDITHGNGCSSDDNYPQEWIANPEIKVHMFHDTSQKCCDKFYAGGNCQIYDSGCQLEATTATVTSTMITASKRANKMLAESKSAPSCAWHPSKGANSMSSCAYSSSYPAAWDNPQWRHMYLYDSHAECCKGSFDLGDCGRVVICETSRPTIKPTNKLHTARDPTPPPSSAPTLQPSTPLVYFIDHFTGVCHDAAFHFRPHYITTTYTSFETCCAASFAKAKCLAEGIVDDPDDGTTPAPAPETYSPTYLPTMTVYYVEHFTGACVDSAVVPMPHYVASNTTKHFNDYRTCCKTSFAREECLGEVPAPEPTGMPTVYVTPDPSYVPSSLPSGQPSLPTVRPTEDDCTDLAWRYDTDYVNGCTNLAPDETSKSVSSSMLLYQSWQECCQIFFSKGQDCRVDDRCQITTEIIPMEDRPRIENSCESHPQYHPDVKHKDGCTNSLEYPASWNELEDQVALFFPTAFQCCEKVYFELGYDCNIRNVCAVIAVTTEDPTKSPTLPYDPCHDQPWHPETDTDPTTGFGIDGCSNAVDFPSNWNWNSNMLFNIAQECCEAHYTVYGLECNVHNTCATGQSSSSLCDSAKWHPSIGEGEAGACSNSLTYPDQWNAPGLSQFMLFDEFVDCCQKHHPNELLSCRRDDDCVDTNAATTKSPTNDGTTTSSTSFTPSCPSAKWHPSQDFSKCTNAFDYPNSWEGSSSLMFDEAVACCVNVFNYANCPTEDICASDDDVVTSSPSQKPTPEPSTKIPTPETSTKNPTPEPSTKIPTTAPTHESTTVDDSGPTNPCSGKAQRECKARLCIWDTSRSSCVLFGGPSRSTPKPISNTPTPAPMKEATRSQCIEKSKKQCVKAPDCGWNINSCTDSDEIVDDNGCDGKMYHPRSATDRTCSNDEDYPELWDKPSMRAIYFFPSADQCCAAFYSDGTCNVVNVCSAEYEPTITTAAQECMERKWHPITAKDRICTNAEDYPPLWDTPPHSEEYLLGSAEKCCQEFYGDGTCKIIDVCEV